MSDFRKLADAFWASPQIDVNDVKMARDLGFAMIINNRPDSETPGQPAGNEIEAAAIQAGLGYAAIPVTHAGFTQQQVLAMADLLQQASGPVLAYCRSGTRSTLLWALAQAASGQNLDEIAGAAAESGYDVAPIREAMETLASQASG